MVWHTSGINTVMGDEPHYLVMADGIGQHGSLKQTLPYREEFASKKIFKPGLGPKDAEPSPDNTHAVQGPHGLYNIHNIGLPLLLALPFLVFGVIGAKLCLIALSALVVMMTWKFTGLFSHEEKHRYWSTFAVCISLPLIPASTQIYPDILAGLLSLTGLYWFVTLKKERSSVQELALAIALAFMPWLQIKLSATCIIIFIAIVGKIAIESRDYKRIIRILAIAIVSCAGLAAYNYYAFGKVTGPYQSDAIEISQTSIMVLVGLFLDQNQGMLFQNPVYFIGLFAIGSLYRYSKSLTILAGLVFLSLLVPNALHHNWYGGGSFSGRFGWSATVVFIIPTIFGLLHMAHTRERLLRSILALFIALQAYFFYVYAIRGVGLYNKITSSWPDNYSIYYAYINNWLPKLYNSEWAYSYTPNYAWIILVIALMGAGFISSKKLKFSVHYLAPLGALMILASGFYNNQNIIEVTFIGKDLPSLTGRVAGSNRTVAPNIDAPGFIIFGPYFPLQKGTYELTVHYDSNAAIDQSLGNLAVVDSTSDIQISKNFLYGTQGANTDFNIHFELNNDTSHVFEFRTQWEGAHTLTIHRMVLRKVN